MTRENEREVITLEFNKKTYKLLSFESNQTIKWGNPNSNSVRLTSEPD
jgi:hypothetical protein